MKGFNVICLNCGAEDIDDPSVESPISIKRRAPLTLEKRMTDDAAQEIDLRKQVVVRCDRCGNGEIIFV